MPEAPDGSIEVIDNRYVIRFERYVIRFERYFDRSIEEVWSALTEPERLKQWVGATEIELGLFAGGSMITRTTEPPELVAAIVAEAGEAALESRDTVLRVEAPRVFEHTFGGSPDSVVCWELDSSGGGCRLRLTHTEPADFERLNAPRDLAGWHELLDLLVQSIEGQRDLWRAWSAERWEEHRRRYAAHLGIDPDSGSAS